MDLLKTIKKENHTEYSITSFIDKIINISYFDVINIVNMLIIKDVYKERFEIDIETKKGEYSFNDINKLNEAEYRKFESEGIVSITIYIRCYYSKEEKDYLYFRLYFRQNLISLDIRTLNEIFTRGLYEQVFSYINNLETWYNCIFKIAMRLEGISTLFILCLCFFTPSLHSIGIGFKYIIFMLGLGTLVLLVDFIVKLNIVHTTNFVTEKKSFDLPSYLKSSDFKKHLINTLVTILITSIINYIIYKR